MTDLYAESVGVAPEPDLSQRLSYGLDMIGAPDLAGLIATAGLAAVYEQLQRTRRMLGENVRAELAIGLQIAHLTDEARRWKRRHAGAVAQARREHARAEEQQCLVGQLTTVDEQGQKHRARLMDERDQVASVLRDVLDTFGDDPHPTITAHRSSWVPVERLDAWRAALPYSPQLPWWEQVKQISNEAEKLRGQLAAERLAVEELKGERADLQLALSEFEGAKARAAGMGQPCGVLAEVHAERDRQDAKWGEQNHPDGTGLPVYQSSARRYGDQAQRAEESGNLKWRDVLLEEVYEALAEADPAKLRTELVQVAAVATAWIEAIDRRTGSAGAAAPTPTGYVDVGEPLHETHLAVVRAAGIVDTNVPGFILTAAMVNQAIDLMRNDRAEHTT